MKVLLRLLMLLSGNRSYSMQEMTKRSGKSERTIFRYLDAIERAGFVLEKKKNADTFRYRLITANAEGRALEKLLHFSEEEAYLLYQTLSELKVSNPLKKRLVSKLHTLYHFKALEQIEKANEAEIIHQLQQAMEQKKQVVLKQYRSSHSGDISDRLVEPFQFTEDYIAVWAYDTGDKTNKQFRISRSGNVESQSCSWQHEKEHAKPFTDAFSMAAEKPIDTVEAILSLKAYNLLIEEHPLSEKYITKEKTKYRLKIPVADYHGIGRFAMGLPGDVKVVGTNKFKGFLKKSSKGDRN